MRGMWCCTDLALVETVVCDLRWIETEPPLVGAGVVVDLDPVARRVHERVDRQQAGVAVADPRNLQKEKKEVKKW